MGEFRKIFQLASSRHDHWLPLFAPFQNKKSTHAQIRCRGRNKTKFQIFGFRNFIIRALQFVLLTISIYKKRSHQFLKLFRKKEQYFQILLL